MRWMIWRATSARLYLQVATMFGRLAKVAVARFAAVVTRRLVIAILNAVIRAIFRGGRR